MNSLSGRALHTGIPSTVRVARRVDDGLGIRFLFPGFNTPLAARDFATLTRRAHRATVLTDTGSGAVIRTPEHLLAAALFFADEPLDITCDAEEIPGLDGSAKPWFDLLTAALHLANRGESRPVDPTTHLQINPLPREYECNLTWEYEGPEGRLRAEPAPYFSVRYTLERGDFGETFALEHAADARDEVLPARTFIFWRDWQTLRGARDASLLTGVDGDSGFVLAESAVEFAEARAHFPQKAANTFPLLHPHAFRMEGEAARHKVLDLLGDLALCGLALPRLRLTIVNGGHALNHLLLDSLQKILPEPAVKRESAFAPRHQGAAP